MKPNGHSQVSARRRTPHRGTADRPRLARVRRSPRSRPRWRILYAGTAVALAAGLLPHLAASDARVARAFDFTSTLAIFAWLFGWIRANGAALRRTGEPGDHSRARVVRIVRSRAPAALTVAVDDDTWPPPLLPYDFR